MKRLSTISLFTVCLLGTQPVYAAQMSALEIYTLASSNNLDGLKLIDSIDTTDQNGNTAICKAIINNDVAAYNTLKSIGADTHPDCVNKIPQSRYDAFIAKTGETKQEKTFLGIGKWGWGLIGAGVVAGGTVAAMSGGSSGGSGSETTGGINIEPNLPVKPETPNCVHGMQSGDVCVCTTGYIGTLCDTLDDGYIVGNDGKVYPKLHCVNGRQITNACSCDRGYTGTLCESWDNRFIEQGGIVYEKKNCINGKQIGDTCECRNGYSGELCQTFDPTGRKTIVGARDTNTNNEVNINNKDWAEIYGVRGTSDTYNAGQITIESNAEADIYGVYSATGNDGNAYNSYTSGEGIINIIKNGLGNVYGVYAASYGGDAYNAYNTAGIIDIKATGDGDVYGVYAPISWVYNSYMSDGIINIQLNGNGDVYGLYAGQSYADNGTGVINIYHNGKGNVGGVFSNGNSTNSGQIYIESNSPEQIYGMHGQALNTNIGSINIIAFGDADVYGAYAGSGYFYNGSKNGNGTISITMNGNGNVYGSYGGDTYNTSLDTTNISRIDIINHGTGYAFGTRGLSAYNDSENSIINIINSGSGTAICAYGWHKVLNRGTIKINNTGTGSAIGIFGDSNSLIENTGTIIITRDSYIDEDGNPRTPSTEISGNVFGIYAKSGSTVTNSGAINIDSNGNVYGIYAESGSFVINTGTININGLTCDATSCDGNSSFNNYIVLDGSVLYNQGGIKAKTLNLDDMGGTVIATNGAQFIVENDISGTLNLSSDIVADGFDTTYTAKNMIQAGNTSKLTLRSGSAMFDARLADNSNDVVMTMKSFDSLTDNKSLAAYLADNYAKGTSAEFFGGLKSGANMTEFNNILNSLSGMNAFTHFDREDMSAMREINFSMNQQMFMNGDRDEYQVSGSMEHFSFSNSSNGGSGSYGISNSRMSDNWKLGYGLAMANIGTNDDLGTSRSNQIGLFYMPMAYTGDDIEFISTPRVGFAKSHYSRRGYNNMNYDGYIEKQIFGFNNDMRYPVSFGNWTIAPDLGLNAIMYRQSGHESDQAFSLIIPADEIYSLEAGFGLFTKYERQLSSGSTLRFNSGVMLYRELADTYNMKLGIRGLDGTFNLYDDIEHDYSGAATLGFDYKTGRFDVYGNAQYFVDADRYMNFKGGISLKF